MGRIKALDSGTSTMYIININHQSLEYFILKYFDLLFSRQILMKKNQSTDTMI